MIDMIRCNIVLCDMMCHATLWCVDELPVSSPCRQVPHVQMNFYLATLLRYLSLYFEDIDILRAYLGITSDRAKEAVEEYIYLFKVRQSDSYTNNINDTLLPSGLGRSTGQVLAASESEFICKHLNKGKFAMLYSLHILYKKK